jgi:MoaA/NifB/PqqE/SkfB family radical SAM enzyme
LCRDSIREDGIVIQALRRNLLVRWLRNVVAYRVDRGQTQIPIVAGLFVTYRCNFRCRYCDDGNGLKFPDQKRTELGTEDTKRVLDRMRQETGFVAFAGGEPLLRRDLEALLRYAREIGFRRVAMNTNAWGIDRRPEVVEHLDDLMVSVDSLDEAYSDDLLGVPAGTTRRVIDNVRLLAGQQREKRFRLMVNSVILPGSIEHLYDVMRLCIELDIHFSPAPRMIGVYPDPSLVGNERYLHLVDAILDLKRHGMRILETDAFLRAIRDFPWFRCLPQVYVRVSPSGRVIFPCLALEEGEGVSVLEHERFADALRAAGEGTRLDQLRCDSRCHVSCYLETSLCVTAPWALLGEAARRAGTKLRTRGAGRKAKLLARLEEHRASAPPAPPMPEREPRKCPAQESLDPA